MTIPYLCDDEEGVIRALHRQPAQISATVQLVPLNTLRFSLSNSIQQNKNNKESLIVVRQKKRLSAKSWKAMITPKERVITRNSSQSPTKICAVPLVSQKYGTCTSAGKENRALHQKKSSSSRTLVLEPVVEIITFCVCAKLFKASLNKKW